MAQRPRVHIDLTQLEDRTTPAIGFGSNAATVPEYADGRVVVGFTTGQEQAGLASVRSSSAVTGAELLGFGIYAVRLAPGVSVPTAIQLLSGKAGVRYVEPDYIGQRTALPNDPMVLDGTQWGVNNFGQNGGTAGADIRASAGWDLATGTGQTVIAVLDDGVDYTHPDLAANMWRNPGEIPGNGVDDDGNGHVDDIFGADFGENDSDPFPHGTDTHGTHVAGTVGAVGNNGIGVSGVLQRTRIMAVNIFTPGTGYFVSDEIRGVAYAVANGAKVINGSIGGTYGFLQSEFDAYDAARAAGVVAVIAAGNHSADVDGGIYFPAGLARSLDNVVTVASTDRNDQLSGFSDYGLATVSIAAPGSDIISTIRGGQYAEFNGTSMATPHVAGAITLFWDANPDMTYQEVVQALKDSARRVPSLASKVSTSGVLDLEAFLNRGGGASILVTGADAGGGPHVKVYSGGGRLLASFFAYDQNFTGGVRVATGDVNGDRTPDIITVAGPSGGPHVKVFDGQTFQEIFSFYAFESTFTGGLTVAAGDVNGDGRADIIVGADKGGGPRVSVFSLPIGGTALVKIADFYAYDSGFSGGVRVAAGLFSAASKQTDIVVAPGAGGGPHVRRFTAASVLAYRPVVAAETMVGDPNGRNGLYVAAGDMDGDGLADVAVGVGSGTPVVTLLNGRTFAPITTFRNPFGGEMFGLLNPNTPTNVGTDIVPSLDNGLLPPGGPPDSLTPTNSNVKPGAAAGYMYGVRVAIMDANGDDRPDLVLSGGPNDAPTVAVFNGVTFSTIRAFNAYAPSFYGGVFVGATGA